MKVLLTLFVVKISFNIDYKPFQNKVFLPVLTNQFAKHVFARKKTDTRNEIMYLLCDELGPLSADLAPQEI
jgi:hypothetical protein